MSRNGDAAEISVLIADDTDDFRAVLRSALELDGRCRVVAEARTGNQAVRLTREHRPDVVVLDLSMPETDGVSALGRIREIAPGTAVLILSGFAREDLSSDVDVSGAAGYLVKGAPVGEIQRAVVEAAGHGS